jgi:hypothetical protein
MNPLTSPVTLLTSVLFRGMAACQIQKEELNLTRYCSTRVRGKLRQIMTQHAYAEKLHEYCDDPPQETYERKFMSTYYWASL